MDKYTSAQITEEALFHWTVYYGYTKYKMYSNDVMNSYVQYVEKY